MNAMEMLGVVAAPEETPAQTAIRAAFKLGQESMRERCAEACTSVSLRLMCDEGNKPASNGADECSDAIRALPLEE